MKTRVKGISLLLAVIMTFSGGLGGSAPVLAIDPRPPITAPPTTVPPTTVPPTTTAPPTTVPPTTTAPPTTVPPTTTAPPTTVPPTTTAPTTVPSTTTAPPTTVPPTTTAPPTTVPPTTTAPPTTVPPTTTAPPTTVPPTTTAPPTTVPPTTTAPPTTVPPTTTAPPTTVPPTTTAPTTVPPTTAPSKIFTAHHAFVYDSTNGTSIYTLGSMDDRIYPASITKLFTTLVALQHLSPDTEVTAGAALNTVPADSSRAFLKMGDVLTVEQLIYGMLLPSGNDAARVLAAAAGRAIKADPNLADIDAMAAFVAEMNVQAAAFGMTGSHFVTPDGWHDSNHYTTMADLLTLAQLCLADPLILEVVKTPQYTATISGRNVYWKNSNMHLKEDSPFYLPDCIGLKTGYTKAAGRCLLSAFLIDGKVIIAGVFGCPDPTYTYITQFQTNMTLYETHIRP